jgi:PiT family inorganic phosphate transporter
VGRHLEQGRLARPRRPFIGFLIAGVIMVGILWLFRRVRPAPLNRGFRLAQVGSGSFMAFAHGTNDAQKTMGVIALALYSAGHTSSPADIPTGSSPSRRLRSRSGRTSAAGGSCARWGRGSSSSSPRRPRARRPRERGHSHTVATKYGFPVSTTHVISSSVMGAGATTRVSAVRWGVAADIVTAWLLTIPAAGLVAAGTYELLNAFM